MLAALAGLGEEGLEVIANGAVAHRPLRLPALVGGRKLPGGLSRPPLVVLLARVRRATGPPAPRHPARPITDRRPQGVPLVARDPDTSCRQRLRGGDVVNERPQQK